MQSRYYDPNTCRFINADGYVSTGQGILGYNMFAYCDNNPIMRVDPNGEKWITNLILSILPVSTMVNHIINVAMIAKATDEIQGTYTIEEAKEEIEKITGEGTVIFSDNSVKIVDSYQVDSRYERIRISKIIENTYRDDVKLTNRSALDMSAEWYGHNLYNVFNDSARTRDVDLDYKFTDNEPKTEIGTILLLLFGIL